MIFSLGAITIDLGPASGMKPIVKEVIQNTTKTAGGLDYTQTWDYYESGGYIFRFQNLEKSLFESFEGFVIFEAQGEKNEFQLTLDDGTTHPQCKFNEKGRIVTGEIDTIGTSSGMINVYSSVGFSVKIYA